MVTNLCGQSGLIQFLHRLNLASTMSCHLLYLPSRLGSTGISIWVVLTCARQVEFLQSALDDPTFYGHTIQTSFLTLQLDYDHGESLLAMMDVPTEGMASI